MIVDFGKIWTAMVFINAAVLIVNFAGVFPEQWNPYLHGISDAYNDIQSQLQTIQSISEENILVQAGAYGYLMLLSLKLAVQVGLLAPVYVGVTLNNLFAGLGFPSALGYMITVITYFSFILWIVDIVRGRTLNAT